ncbi:uncharacterized protein LOC118420798 [Branchiostoma floridae]|nr:uncharacterized protein LOC118420798 [Branchiostoma floridae]
MEIRFPKTKSVCHWVKGCMQGSSGRAPFLAVFKYFNGDNAEKAVIGEMKSPIVVQVKTPSEEEERKDISACDLEYQICVILPDAWIDQGKDIPKPKREGMSTFDNEFADAYVISLKGVTDAVLESTLTERIAGLRQKLEEKELEFNKDWVLIFKYDAPFTPPEETVTYMAFLKPSATTDEEMSSYEASVARPASDEEKPAKEKREGGDESKKEAEHMEGEEEVEDGEEEKKTPEAGGDGENGE